MGCLNCRGRANLLVILCVLIFGFLFFINKKITDDINDVSAIPSPAFQAQAQSLEANNPASAGQLDSDSAPVKTDILGNIVKETKKIRMKEAKGLDIVYEPKPGHKDIYLPN